MKTKDKRQTDRARVRSRQKTEQDVVYTQPKPFNRNRFLLQLVTVAAVVLALLVGMSIFFKVKNVEISGAVKYDAYKIRQASGIIDGEGLITLSKNRISARILDEFDYIDTVQIDKRLPDTVVIQVTELDVVYAAQDQDNNWWLMSAGGKIVEKTTEAAAQEYTRVLGVQLAAPELGAQAVAYEPTQEPDDQGNTVPVTVYAQERLAVALSILQNLENESFVGSIAKVDVSSISNIEMWYSNRFQMLLGDANDLPKKINALAQALDLKEDYETGILDASFTTWPDQVGHSQFP